ncbi:MAG: hypothetical protein ABIH66_01675 [bacterium]
MRKAHPAIVVMLALAICLAGCSRKEEGPKYSTFTSEESKFSVEVPKAYENLEKSTSQADTEAGTLPMNIYFAEDSKGAYAVIESVFPVELVQGHDAMKKVLQSSKNGMLGGSKPIKEEDTEVEGTPALYFRAVQQTGEGKDMYMDVKLFMLGGSMYQLQAVAYEEATLDAGGAEHFLNSFKYLGEDEEAAESGEAN